MTPASELLLLRHAPAETGGRLAGRRDVPAVIGDLAALAAAIGPVTRVIASPAQRCMQTARALWPETEIATDPRLWEQDFGAWEGTVPPDLGPLSRPALARHTPPNGESFAAMCARVTPALTACGTLPGRTVIVAHAGTVRAALALAFGDLAAALAFVIDPLSRTRLIPAGDDWAIAGVNLPAPPC